MLSKEIHYIAHTEEDLPAIAAKILALTQSNIFLLTGDLGAGKTSLTKVMTDQLGIMDKATSPSFSIINEYKSKKGKIYHIDLYRLESMDEALEIGIEEYLYSGFPCFIEWPEIIYPLLPNDCHKLEICILEKDERKIIFS